MFYKVGTILDINGLKGTVIGYIQYANTRDRDKRWYEYRLKTDMGERWLSCDEEYNEYSISWADNSVRGNIGPEWHEVDRGEERVVNYGGDVDVDMGETALFVEYEDVTEEFILSSEVWSDGTEYSRGQYVEPQEIRVVGYEEVKNASGEKLLKAILLFLFLPYIFVAIVGIISIFAGSSGPSMMKYMKNNMKYSYLTSITGNDKQKAEVYECTRYSKTDDVAKNLINVIEGKTESVTQREDLENQEIAIVTKKEYCLIYHPEDDPEKILIQVSKRRYNYSTDKAPYRSSSTCSSWYRNHYYSSSYRSDAKSYKKTPSAYSSYRGETVHNIGNGYFDTYSRSVRQSSTSSRRSSSGGISSGK